MRSRKKILTIAIITVASVIVAGLTVQIPKLMGQLTDAFLHNKQVEYFFMILLVFLVVTKVLALMSEYLTERIGCQYAQEIRRLLIEKYFTINYADNLKYKNGEYRQLFTNDINNLQLLFSQTLPTCVQQVTMFFGAIYLLWGINHWLLLCVLLTTIIYIFPFKFFGTKQQRSIQKLRKTQAALQGLVANSSDNKTEIYQYNNINFFSQLYRRLQQKWGQAFLQIDVSKNLFKTFPRTLDALAPALALLVGGVMIMRQLISLGQLVSVMGLITYINAPFKAFFSILVDIQQALVSKRALTVYLNSADVATGVKEISKITEITIFYDSQLVLQALPGMHIYLLGKTGSGKTTFLRGLCAEQVYSKYQYVFNNCLSTQIKNEAFKKQLALVAQQTVIILGTIRENIFFNNVSQLSRPETLFLNQWAQRFPAGLNTQVGHGAYQLSGGERQVICLFRALAQATPVLLLDEITASLDPETTKQIRSLINTHQEAIIFEALHRTEELSLDDKVIFFPGLDDPPLVGKYESIAQEMDK